MMHFRLGRIPVFVHFSHVLMSGCFAYILFSEASTSEGWPGKLLQHPGTSQYLMGMGGYVFAWIAIVFLSVLIHELGHAVVSLAFGYRPSIYLAWLGGHTNPNAEEPIVWWRDVLLTLAGPLFGLILALVAFGAHRFVESPHSFGDFFLNSLFGANMLWALLNLVPVAPLDGGRISVALLMRLFGRVGFLMAQILGLAAAGAVIFAVSSSLHDRILPAILFGAYAFRSLAMIAAYFRGEAPGLVTGEKPLANKALAEATSLFDRSALIEAKKVADRALETDLPLRLRSRFHGLLGWIALKEGMGRAALDHFSQVHGTPVEPEALAAGFSLVGDDARALPLWQKAAQQSRNRTITHEWAGCLLRLGRVEEAKRVSGVDLATAYRCAYQVLFSRGSYSEAARIGLLALDLQPQAETAYETACALARAGDAPAAIRALNRATELGFTDVGYALSDADLASIHGQSGFVAWAAHFKKPTADKSVT